MRQEQVTRKPRKAREEVSHETPEHPLPETRKALTDALRAADEVLDHIDDLLD